MAGLINPNPIIYGRHPTLRAFNQSQLVPDVFERIDAEQVFRMFIPLYHIFISLLINLKPFFQKDLIRDIRDPEHPYSLEELNVVREESIVVKDNLRECIIRIEFTPTVPHCTLATLIGLCLRVQLNRNLPKYAKVLHLF